MTRKILYTAQELCLAQAESQCVTVDCRHYLDRPEDGYKNYLEAHIPGAVYAHLDRDLSSPITKASGRHPLPNADSFASFLSRAGWSPGKLLVAYDDAGGAIAARLWWLLKYFGHDCGALLDGGIGGWVDAGFELEHGAGSVLPAPLTDVGENRGLVLSATEIDGGLRTDSIVLADARAGERFRGEVEPIDTVAGHIPGAVTYPYTRVLTEDGKFRVTEEIRQSLEEFLGERPAFELVHMCGSGVTACLNLFAAELAGMQGSRLYVGSWSEWIRDSSRPVEP